MRRTPLDVQGQRFGALEVIERAGSSKKGAALWLCECHRYGYSTPQEAKKARDEKHAELIEKYGVKPLERSKGGKKTDTHQHGG